jgi:hypothetical protein
MKYIETTVRPELVEGPKGASTSSARTVEHIALYHIRPAVFDFT